MVEPSGPRPDTPPTALGNFLDIVERISRMASIAAIPVVLAIGGWIIQRQLQNQSISRDYVQLALNILQNPDQSKVAPELREWAVDLLNDNSSTKLNAKAVASLKSGTVTLPSFSFVPSRALTTDLKTELESSLSSFQSYMQKLGFHAGTHPVSVKITPGSDYQGMVAAWDAETDLIIVAEAFARDKVTVLRQLAHGLLNLKWDQSRECLAIESGLATYLASSFLNHPKIGDLATADGQNTWQPRNLLNSRNFSEIQLNDYASVQNDGSEIWGGVFWQLRQLLGQDGADRLLAQTWQTINRADNRAESLYADFVDVLLDGSKTAGEGSNLEAVRGIFLGRGMKISASHK